MHSALASLSVPTVVYKPVVLVGRSWVYIRIRRKRGHSRQQAGSHRKADRKELGWRRSQDHSRAARALALARFPHNRLHMVVAVVVPMPTMTGFMMPMALACPNCVCGHRREKDESDAEQVYFFHLCLR